MTRAEIVRGLAVIRAAFPQQTIPPETIQLYADRLLALPEDPDAFWKAVSQVVDTQRFFPALADILAAFRQHRTPQKALEEPQMDAEVVAANLERIAEIKAKVDRYLAENWV